MQIPITSAPGHCEKVAANAAILKRLAEIDKNCAAVDTAQAIFAAGCHRFYPSRSHLDSKFAVILRHVRRVRNSIAAIFA
jgi:hypothetical protein